MVDTFLVVGELALFVALVDRWLARARFPAWVITLAGLAVSVAGNVGHVHGHDPLVRATLRSRRSRPRLRWRSGSVSSSG